MSNKSLRHNETMNELFYIDGSRSYECNIRM